MLSFELLSMYEYQPKWNGSTYFYITNTFHFAWFLSQSSLMYGTKYISIESKQASKCGETLNVFNYALNSVKWWDEITFLHFLDTKYTMQLDKIQSLSSSEVTHTCGEIDAFNLFLIETETVNELFGRMTTACEYPDSPLCMRARCACMWVMRMCLCASCYRYMVCSCQTDAGMYWNR